MLSFLPLRPWLICAGLVACAMIGSPSAAAGQESALEAMSRIVSVRLAMPIHPIAVDHLERALDQATADGAVAVIVELDTPGGSLAATRRLVQAILASDVPVVVWVGPGGAQAASAGFFLLLAADIAAMAPGTNTGAAHPVAGSGQDIEGDMGRKVEADTLALARTLAQRRGRDVELAQDAVRASRSFTAAEALAAGLIDLEAADFPALLTALDGRPVGHRPDAPTLHTAGATVNVRELPLGKRVLAAVAHPQIAGLLMALGMLGLYVEISNPGLILPGTFGAIALVLGCFALSVLPINVAGLALLTLALGFFVAETQVPTFGVLTLGGTAALIFGLSMLFEGAGPTFAVHPAYPIVLGLVLAGLIGFTSWQTLQVRHRPPATGRETLIGQHGEARTDFAAGGRSTEDLGAVFRGKVWVHGELWNAESSTTVAAGEPIEVESLDGLLLHVRPTAEPVMPATPGSAL